jgi:hypothetical protein
MAISLDHPSSGQFIMTTPDKKCPAMAWPDSIRQSPFLAPPWLFIYTSVENIFESFYLTVDDASRSRHG